MIDQLAAGQALRVGARQRQHAALAQRDQVGGGAADVDQQRIAGVQHQRGVARAGQPVGRRDLRPALRHLIRPVPTRVAGVEVDGAGPQALGQQGRDALHAVLSIGEQIDHLAGHRDGVHGRFEAGPAFARGGQRLLEVLQALPERAGPLRHVLHLALPQPAGLDMRAADVPADDVHFSGSTARGASRDA